MFWYTQITALCNCFRTNECISIPTKGWFLSFHYHITAQQKAFHTHRELHLHGSATALPINLFLSIDPMRVHYSPLTMHRLASYTITLLHRHTQNSLIHTDNCTLQLHKASVNLNGVDPVRAHYSTSIPP